jgi:hypothetical protein
MLTARPLRNGGRGGGSMALVLRLALAGLIVAFLTALAALSVSV